MRARRIVARLALSLFGGVALMFGVTVAGGVLSTYTDDPALRTLLTLPARWPRYVYYYLAPASWDVSLYFDDAASLVALVVCDVIFYGLLVYLALWLRSHVRAKAERAELQAAPPPPPSFSG